MRFDPADILAPPIIALVFLCLGLLYGRTIRQGQPLTPVMRMILGYGFLFVLGTLYSIAFVVMLGWPRPLWIVFTVAWALMLASIAWWRYRQRQSQSQGQSAPEISRRRVAKPLR